MDSNLSTEMPDDDELLAALRRRASERATRIDSDDAPPPLPPVAVPDLVSLVEGKLGMALHPFLRRVYTEVANGGFGPGYGLRVLSLLPDDASLVHIYESFREGGSWPQGVLPLWDWGDAAWSCIDNASLEGTIITHDDVEGAIETEYHIRSWLRAWVGGVNLWEHIYEDKEVTVTNPFTKKPMLTKVRGFARGKRWTRRP